MRRHAAAGPLLPPATPPEPAIISPGTPQEPYEGKDSDGDMDDPVLGQLNAGKAAITGGSHPDLR